MDYDNTSFGGGGGGGFMPGEMSASPSGGGRSDLNNPTLRPVTIKQALDATQPYPEANFQVDGADTASITFIGQVRNISTQTTNVTYKIDDGTGEIEAKQWIDTTTAADTMETDDGKGPGVPGKNQVELNGYARCFGRMKSFGNKKFVSAHCVRPVRDINEVHVHFLESVAVHLLFARGPPGGKGARGDAGAGFGVGGDATMGGMDDYGSKAPLPAMSPTARRVFNLLKTDIQTAEGLHIQLIGTKLGLQMMDVQRAIDELAATGSVFSTIDEYTWSVM